MEQHLCACGCGQSTKYSKGHGWAKFAKGHNNRGKPSPRKIDLTQAPLCACGCGQQVTGRRRGQWNRYLHGHSPRVVKHRPESIEKMRLAAQARNINGAANPAWRGGSAPETYRQHPGRQQKHWWLETRDRIRARDNNCCVLCKAITRLDMHHVDGNLANQFDGNFVTLCHACHMRLEFSLESQHLKEQVLTYVAKLILRDQA